MINNAMQPGFTNRSTGSLPGMGGRGTDLFSPWARLFGSDIVPKLFGAGELEPEEEESRRWWGGGRRGGGGGYNYTPFTPTPYKTPRWFQDMIMWRI